MADETRTKTRIYELTEATTLSADMNIPVDTESGGTKRIQMSTLIDENLDTEGKAADAKKTGDEITLLKQDISELDVLPNVAFSDKYGYYDGSGAIITAHTNGEKTTDKIPIENVKYIDFTLSVGANVPWQCYVLFNSSGAFISGSRVTWLTNGTKTITPSDWGTAAYIAFSYRTYDTYTPTISVFKPIESYISSAVDPLVELTSELLFANPVPNQTLEAWVRYSNGEIVASGATYAYQFTDSIPKRIKAFLTSDTDVLCAIAFYNSTTIGTASYMASASVDFASGNHDSGLWYDAVVPENCKAVVITTKKPSATVADPVLLFDISADVKKAETIAKDAVKVSANNTVTRFLDRPCYDHLFVNNKGNSVVIPHESLYHVRISKSFGFDIIEANVASTSDGVYIVNHLDGGMFGGYFHHVDGSTDISNVSVSSVTWEWIVENVRYNSQIEKYRTRPCTLQEFLFECRQQNLIPFLGKSDDANVVAIATQIMGKDCFIAYNGTRTTCPTATISRWEWTKRTKEEVLAFCESYGKPFIYGMGNTYDYTQAEINEIANLLHANGYWLAVSYADGGWYRYKGIGADFNGTQTRMNRITEGNLHNINTIFGFDGFTYSSATVSNGTLVFSDYGTISPDIPATTYELCGIDLELWFDGTVNLNAIGEMGSSSETAISDGSYAVFFSVPIINGSPKFTMNVVSGTVIKDIKFKASVY